MSLILSKALVVYLLFNSSWAAAAKEKNGGEVTIDIDEFGDPELMAAETCKNEHVSCMYVAVNAIERHQAIIYNKELKDWRFNEHCNCNLPPRNSSAKHDILQFLHIPKTGTAFNWFLHDYFDNCTTDADTSDEPCTRWLSVATDQVNGLCDGRLYSCAGHRVAPNIYQVTNQMRTNMVTLLRHPWARLSSDYHYFRTRPTSAHLSPEIDAAHLIKHTHSIYDHALYPGIANCATKMLNGIQCGAVPNPPLNHTHLAIAKDMLMLMIFVGVTEHFKSSVCLMAWMHGGNPQPSHFRPSRQGNYPRQTMEQALTPDELATFTHSERFDLELYAYGRSVFLNRLELSGCPLLPD
jgi:hypothetical protein